MESLILKKVKAFLQTKGRSITPEIQNIIDLITNPKNKGLYISELLLTRLFDSQKPFLNSNRIGSQNPIYNLLLLLLWMKIHGPFPKRGFNTWVVNENLQIQLPNELPNDDDSCNIVIISHGKQNWSQEFNTSAMVSAINEYMMTPEELEKQKAFRDQEQEREDALKKAHNSFPRTCGGVRGCKYCQSKNYSTGYT